MSVPGKARGGKDENVAMFSKYMQTKGRQT